MREEAISDDERRRVEGKVGIARRNHLSYRGVSDFGHVLLQTCSRRSGVLVQLREGGLIRYR